MGSSTFDRDEFKMYSRSMGKTYNSTTNRVEGQVYRSRMLNEQLNPKNVIRECCNSDEHPNTIPVILALDVTGSMGGACQETAEALGVIMEQLYKKFKDIEIMVMGIGDLAYDKAPIQISQFESDVRIAEWLDKIYMEHGGGGNSYESYTAAWYMGLRHTKLDAYDKQGRKGIIITMGDEPLNPYLPKSELSNVTGDSLQGDIETKDLFKDASEKFDIYHIAVDSPQDSYSYYEKRIKESFGNLLGQRFMISTIGKLGDTICDCIANSVEDGNPSSFVLNEDNKDTSVENNEGGISW